MGKSMGDIKFLKNKYIFFYIIYLTILVFFAMFSYRILFHDTWEYICLAKNFAGFFNSDVFTVHSLVYPFFISLFIKYVPSLLTMKLVNAAWIVLIGFMFYNLDLKKTSFLIWTFSPIAWMYATIISPIVPASFFLLTAYLSIREWQENKKNRYFIISALALGLSAAFYDLAAIFIVFFVLAFFYDKKLKESIVYALFVFLSFSIRLILDASLFSIAIKDKLIPFPFYSISRFWGAMIVIWLGLHPMIPALKLSFLNWYPWVSLIFISPLIFYIFKIKYQKHKSIVIFLILSFIFLFIIKDGHMYYLLLAPITIALLSRIFKRRELISHITLSFLITILMVYPYFIQDEQEIEKRNLIINDLRSINEDFSFNAVVFKTRTLARFYLWEKEMPYFISPEDYHKIVRDDKYYTQYDFEVKSKIDIQKILEFKAGLKTNIKQNVDYQDLPWIAEKGEKVPEEYKLTKCYTLLCIYQK